MSKIERLGQMVKRLEPTNGPTVLVDVTFLELKQLLAVVRAAQMFMADDLVENAFKLEDALATLEGDK